MTDDRPAVYLAGPVNHARHGGEPWRAAIEHSYSDRFDFKNPLVWECEFCGQRNTGTGYFRRNPCEANQDAGGDDDD